LNLNTVVSEYLKSPEFKKLQTYHPLVKVEACQNPDLKNISASPVHIFKTVMNLISNAAEAMPDGGNIRISTENRYLKKPFEGYTTIAAGSYAVLSISDSGTGIAQEDLERIFEPFFTKKKMGRSGTGLGMAVVWGTVNDHKGFIDIHTKEGEGTTFTLYFPITHAKSKKEKPAISINDLKGHGESILVVDDVKEQRDVAYEILKKLDYSVMSVASGEKAIEYLKDNSADLLVLDMIMSPGMDGLETFRRVCGIVPDQKAVIVSGFTETEKVRQAQALGAGAYVKKPYSVETIARAVRNTLEQR
jgi:CheY-like chemotaxis protein